MLMGMSSGTAIVMAESHHPGSVVRADGFFDIGFRVSNPSTSSVVTVTNTAPRRIDCELNPGMEAFSLDSGATFQKVVNNTTNDQQVHMFTLSVTLNKTLEESMAMVIVTNAMSFNGARLDAAAMWPD